MNTLKTLLPLAIASSTMAVNIQSNAQVEWRNYDMGDHSYAQTDSEEAASLAQTEYDNVPCASAFCESHDVCRSYRGYLMRISTGGPYWSNSSRTDFSDVPKCSADVYKNTAA